jgi:hypothetical protein
MLQCLDKAHQHRITWCLQYISIVLRSWNSLCQQYIGTVLHGCTDCIPETVSSAYFGKLWQTLANYHHLCKLSPPLQTITTFANYHHQASPTSAPFLVCLSADYGYFPSQEEDQSPVLSGGLIATIVTSWLLPSSAPSCSSWSVATVACGCRCSSRCSSRSRSSSSSGKVAPLQH